jgi:hypothetical protein
VDGCHFHDLFIHDTRVSAMYLGKSASHGVAPIHNIEIDHNRFERIGTEAVQLRQATVGAHVHHNYGEDIGIWINEPWQHFVNVGAPLAIGPESGGEWHDNTFYRANWGIYIHTQHSPDPDLIVHHNLLVDCGGHRPGEGGGIRQGGEYAAFLHHNTIVGGLVHGITVTDETTTGEIRDNLIVACPVALDAPNVPQHHNLVLASVDEAKFYDAPGGDYRLVFASPARTAGSDGRCVGALPDP